MISPCISSPRSIRLLSVSSSRFSRSSKRSMRFFLDGSRLTVRLVLNERIRFLMVGELLEGVGTGQSISSGFWSLVRSTWFLFVGWSSSRYSWLCGKNNGNNRAILQNVKHYFSIRKFSPLYPCFWLVVQPSRVLFLDIKPLGLAYLGFKSCPCVFGQFGGYLMPLDTPTPCCSRLANVILSTGEEETLDMPFCPRSFGPLRRRLL